MCNGFERLSMAAESVQQVVDRLRRDVCVLEHGFGAGGWVAYLHKSLILVCKSNVIFILPSTCTDMWM